MAFPLSIADRWRLHALVACVTASALASATDASAQMAEPSPPVTPPSPTAPPLTSTSSTHSTSSTDPPEEPAAGYRPHKLKPWALNFAATFNTLSGDDFDGEKGVNVPGANGGVDAVLIPELGSGAGFQIGVGYGLYPERLGSVGFWIGVTYAATWLSPRSPYAPSDSNSAILHDVEVPMRLAYRASRSIAPYAQVAVGYGILPLNGFHAVAGSTQGTVSFDDETTVLVSKSFCFGVGSLFPINETVSVDAFAGYRAFIVTNIDGNGMDDGLNAGGWQFHLGPAFYL